MAENMADDCNVVITACSYAY